MENYPSLPHSLRENIKEPYMPPTSACATGTFRIPQYVAPHFHTRPPSFLVHSVGPLAPSLSSPSTCCATASWRTIQYLDPNSLAVQPTPVSTRGELLSRWKTSSPTSTTSSGSE